MSRSSVDYHCIVCQEKLTNPDRSRTKYCSPECRFGYKIGDKFNRLTIVSVYIKDYVRRAICRCDCGNTHDTILKLVKRGHSKSCGCLKIECTINRSTRHGRSSRISKKLPVDITYGTWLAMRIRCLQKSAINYSHYGGRGITICEQWINDFNAFLKDMGERPTKLHTLDRIDSNGNYEPENCRWATWKEQRANQKPHKPRRKKCPS